MVETSIVVSTVAQFIGAALIIVMLMIAYYVVRLFLVPPPTKEERAARRKEQEEQQTKFGEWLGGKLKERKLKALKEQRKGDVSVVKDNIKDALEGMEDIPRLLNKASNNADLTEARKKVERVKQDLHNAVSNLRILRRKHEGTDRQVIQKAINETHTVEQNFIVNVEQKIPKTFPKNRKTYNGSISSPMGQITTLRGSLGTIWNDLEEFHTKFGEKTT